jgi:hypothetical protein
MALFVYPANPVNPVQTSFISAPPKLFLGLPLTNPLLCDTPFLSMRNEGTNARTGQDGHPSAAAQTVSRQNGTQTGPIKVDKGG